MPRARTPLMKAAATGRAVHDPKRFKLRREPVVTQPLGPPPKWMKGKGQMEAWNTFARDLPWLNRSHRAFVSIASEMQGRIIVGEELPVSGYNLLRICLGQLGATPTDSSKVSMPDDESTGEDPSKQYF